MLISYSLKNYRSYKDRQTISFLAQRPGKALRRKPLFLYEDENICLTKLAFILGANASGKSNLLIGLRSIIQYAFALYPRNYTHDPSQTTKYESKEASEIPYMPFFGIDGTAEHEIEYYIPSLKKAYRYTLIIDSGGVRKEVLEEHSGQYRPQKYTPVFTRTNDHSLSLKNPSLSISAEFNTEIDYGRTFSPEEFLAIKTLIDQNMHHYQSLLALLMIHMPGPYFQEVRRALEQVKVRFNVLQPSQELFEGKRVLDYLREQGPVYDTLLNLIRISDSSISRISLRPGTTEILFHYSYRDGEKIVPFADLSEGTKKMCYLSRDILGVLWEKGTLVGDELDGKIHPFILALLFEVLLSPKYHSQIVCSIHTPIVIELLNRLPSGGLPRSSLYFTEKRPDGSTCLQSYAGLVRHGVMKRGEFLDFIINTRYISIPSARGWMFEDFLQKAGE